VDDLLVEVLAGLAVGVGMGLVGAGGAIFTVPVFGALLGHAPKDAFLEALAVTGCIAAASAAMAIRAGRVDRRRAVIFAAAGILGTQAAAPLAVRMDARIQVVLFAAVAAYAAWRMWNSSKEPVLTSSGGAEARGGSVGSLALGFAIGALTSVLGVGGGFLLIPAFVLREGLSMPTAVATSLAVIAVNSAAGLLGQWWSGGFASSAFDLGAVCVTAGFGLVGSWAGAHLAHRLPQSIVRRTFAVLLALVAFWMVVRSAGRA
jgi:uncharacterized membrane protein YfcA